MVQQSGTEGVAKQSVVEMLDGSPNGVVSCAAFREKNMDVGVPLQASSKGMQNANESGSKTLGLIQVKKQP